MSLTRVHVRPGRRMLGAVKGIAVAEKKTMREARLACDSSSIRRRGARPTTGHHRRRGGGSMARTLPATPLWTCPQ
jgi:hypothetical protein